MFMGQIILLLHFLSLVLFVNFDRRPVTTQYKISTPERMENPEKSPKVPPMLDIMSTVETVAVLTILKIARYFRSHIPMALKNLGLT